MRGLERDGVMECSRFITVSLVIETFVEEGTRGQAHGLRPLCDDGWMDVKGVLGSRSFTFASRGCTFVLCCVVHGTPLAAHWPHKIIKISFISFSFSRVCQVVDYISTAAVE